MSSSKEKRERKGSFGADLQGNTEVRMGSERSFAWVFGGVFLIIALFPLLSSDSPRIWALLTSLAFFLVGAVRPEIVRPLNRLWFRFGLLLNKIISPIVMGIIFFSTVTPIGLIRRLFNADPLNQKFDPESDTYWINIDPEKERHSSMKQQF